MTIEIAGKKIRKFDAFDDPKLVDHPKMEDLPEEYQRGKAPGCKIFEDIFFGVSGRKTIQAYDRKLKEDVDPGEFYSTLNAFMRTFSSSHELKTAVCGLIIDTCTEELQ